MLVVLASEHESTAESFRSLERSSDVEFMRLSREEVRKWVRDRAKCGERRSGCLLYIDVVGLGGPERKRLIRYLLKSESVLVAICDPLSDVKDPASWFHAGVADYLPAGVLEDGVKPSRIRAVSRFDERAQGSSAARGKAVHGASVNRAIAGNGSGPVSGLDGAVVPIRVDRRFPGSPPADLLLNESPRDWGHVEIGSEYTFGMLYVGLDVHPNTIRDASADLITASIGSFQDAIIEVAGPHGGHLWFWKDYAGVILFPYDGVHCEAILAGMRIMLRRIFWQAEQKTNFITKHFRMSLHVGNLVYREGGDRETLVSDLVNYLFHLGTKFTPPGEFVITADIGHCCPHGLRSCFEYQGRYRSHEIWRMKKLLTPREASVTLVNS